MNILWTKKDNIIKYTAFRGEKKKGEILHVSKTSVNIFVDYTQNAVTDW